MGSGGRGFLVCAAKHEKRTSVFNLSHLAYLFTFDVGCGCKLFVCFLLLVGGGYVHVDFGGRHVENNGSEYSSTESEY